jgi:branched-chain amino acid aminotransferase
MTIDWQKLGFTYIQTRCHIRYTWRDGAWDAGELHDDPTINLHIAATALHYGQACFEGLKAFAQKDGSIRVFRVAENARRMQASAARTLMEAPDADMFIDAVKRVVAANHDFVPPYGTGGSLYIRPLLIGSGPRIGVAPADEYTFIVLVLPVGNYYKGGLQPVSAMVVEGYDRAAPLGVGNAKVAGNYAADMIPNKVAKAAGCPINLYLDAKEHRYIDEFGTSNFLGITKDGRYVTPSSPSILASITNMTLMTLANDSGMPVEQRPIALEEVRDMSEVGACGTAVVVTPVNRIIRGDTVYEIGPAEGCGPVLQQLYNTVRGIQTGELPDRHDWLTTVPV